MEGRRYRNQKIKRSDSSGKVRACLLYTSGHIHIAENHRYQPGTGSIDWARHMETLKKIGYEGAVVNEGRVRGENPLAVYQESVHFMKQFI